MAHSFQRIVIIASLFALAAAPKALTKEPPANKPVDQPPATARVAVTISKETTYITEPLRKDGYIDYVAALDQRFRLGVTPENNAAVLFWQAVGPSVIWESDRETYFQMLGIVRLPEKGDYFINLEQYLALQKAGSKQKDAKAESEAEIDPWQLLAPVKKRPWSKQEFPVLAQWLAANEKPLTLVVACSKRPRFYDPLVGGGKRPLMCVSEPSASLFHQTGNIDEALVVRAMLLLNEGHGDEAWEDLLVCHRLARLVGQGPTWIHASTASGIEEHACAGDQAFLQHTHLTATQVAKMREDLNRLPPMLKMGDKTDIAERFTYLNTVSDFSSEGRASLAELTGLSFHKEFRKTINMLIHYSASTPIDWDVSLRMGNAWFDRIADANRKPTRAEQKKALSRIVEDLRTLKNTAADTVSLDKLMLDNPRKALSERLGQVLLCTFGPESSISSSINVDDRQTMRFELDKLAFALAAYCADHNSFPVKLEDLKPKYVAELPKDVCNDGALHYLRKADGYLLYSVGQNGRDDGGKGFEDRNQNEDSKELVKKGEDWDDMVVCVPAPAMEKKEPQTSAGPPEKLSAADATLLDSLTKKIQQSVKELDYTEQTARDFARMVGEWKDPHGNVLLLALSRKVGRAKQDYEKHALTKAEMARIEEEVVDDFMNGELLKITNKTDHYALEDLVKDKEANCLGYTQFFYVLGNSIGLSTQAIFVEEMFEHSMPLGYFHVACLVQLTDGKEILVDLACMKVSDPFVFREQYSQVGNFWELQDKRNPFGIHPVIQRLDRNGLIGCIYINRAKTDMDSGRCEQAVKLLTKAIELDRNNALSIRNRGSVYLKLGQKDLAITDFTKSADLNPKDATTYFNRGISFYGKAGQYDQAILDFTKAIELNPKFVEAYCNRGSAYLLSGQRRKAIADFTKTIELNPKLSILAVAYFELGIAMMENKEETKKDLRKQ